ncbi:restriction endonuclease subunit S [Serratia liquefaciens]|uniref:restriction endonuclease subunit S n=2 Tax=Gammaproteobacteria TaxID=1236 RepID=UPI0032DF9ACF
MSFKTYALEDVLEITSSKRIKMAEYVQSGIPFYRSKEIIEKSNNQPVSTDIFITCEHFDKIKMKFGAPEAGDILLTSVGTLGVSYQVSDDDLFYFKDGNLTWFRNFNSRVLSGYIYCWLKSPLARKKLDEISIGTTQRALTIASLKKIQIKIPSLDVQKKIVFIYESLSKKIINNGKINQTLEQMAQALFKNWFVDFEPVKAKIAVLDAGGSQEDATLAAMTAISGKDADSLAIFEREYPEKYTELRATAELFPPTMQESELGDIPAGWTSQRMSNIATLHYGKALKKTERIDGPYPVYGSGGITGSHNAYLVEGPGIIVGRKGSIGTIYWEDGKFHPIDTVYYVATKEEIPLSYLYYLMKTLNLPSMNTDAAVPGLNRDNVYRLEVLKPTQSILNKFDNHIATIRNSIQKNNNTIVSLVGLRDTLLPKLLSGEIPLPETEEIAKEADYV